MVPSLTARSLRRCFFRSNMLMAGYNLYGIQNIGFLYAMLPGLEVLYPDQEKFTASCHRYADYYNCHNLWGPFLVGAFLNSERQISMGQIQPEMVSAYRDITLNSLSALGDSFFSGSMVVGICLLLSCLAVSSCYAMAATLLAILLGCFFLFRLFSFYLGLVKGMTVIAHIRRLNIRNWSGYIKIFNSFLLALFLALALTRPGTETTNWLRFLPGNLQSENTIITWVLSLAGILIITYLIGIKHFSRSIILIVMAVLLIL